MIRLLWLSLSVTWREQYPKNLMFFADMFASALDVIFYYFTSESFGKAFGSQNYFQYVLWGEMVTTIPTTLLLLPTRSLRTLLTEGSFDILRTCPRPFWEILLVLNYGEIFRQLARLIFICLFAVALGFTVNPVLILKSLGLILISAPLFWSLGLCAAAFFIFFGRGMTVLQHLSHIMTVLAGVYFPLKVLPPVLANLVSWLSPMNWVLVNLRSEELLMTPLILTLVASPILTILGFVLLRKSLAHLKKSGNRLLLPA